MADSSSAFSINFDAEVQKQNEEFKSLPVGFLNDIKQYKFRLITFFLCSVASAVSFVFIPEYLGKLIDSLVNSVFSAVLSGQNKIIFSNLLSIIIPAFVVILLNAFFTYFCGIISTDIASQYGNFIRKKAFCKIQNASMLEIDTSSKNAINEILTTETDKLNQSINILLSQVITSAILVIAIVIRCFLINYFTGLVVLTIIPLSYLFLKLISYFSADKNDIKKYAPDVEELLGNMTTIHCSGKTDSVTDMILEKEKEKLNQIRKMRFLEFISQLPTVFFTGVGIAVLIYVFTCSKSIIIGSVTLGTILSVLFYVKKVESPLNNIFSFSSTVGNLLSSSNRIYRFLDRNDEISGDEELTDCEKTVIEVNKIKFTYSDELTNVLDDFSATFISSGITQIKGKTGCGKTTLLKLILGYYQPQSGEIRINGRSLSELRLMEYRKLFSVITQEAKLFEISIAENIAYPSKEIDYGKIEAIFKAINQESILSQLEDGLDTIYRKNQRDLSDGQIQIILLVKALYNDKRFIILDESFSHIDEENEAEIYNELKSISENIGIIIISHRNLPFDASDNIIEL